MDFFLIFCRLHKHIQGAMDKKRYRAKICREILNGTDSLLGVFSDFLSGYLPITCNFLYSNFDFIVLS